MAPAGCDLISDLIHHSLKFVQVLLNKHPFMSSLDTGTNQPRENNNSVRLPTSFDVSLHGPGPSPRGPRESPLPPISCHGAVHMYVVSQSWLVRAFMCLWWMISWLRLSQGWSNNQFLRLQRHGVTFLILQLQANYYTRMIAWSQKILIKCLICLLI